MNDVRICKLRPAGVHANDGRCLRFRPQKSPPGGLFYCFKYNAPGRAEAGRRVNRFLGVKSGFRVVELPVYGTLIVCLMQQ